MPVTHILSHGTIPGLGLIDRRAGPLPLIVIAEVIGASLSLLLLFSYRRFKAKYDVVGLSDCHLFHIYSHLQSLTLKYQFHFLSHVHTHTEESKKNSLSYYFVCQTSHFLIGANVRVLCDVHHMDLHRGWRVGGPIAGKRPRH